MDNSTTGVEGLAKMGRQPGAEAHIKNNTVTERVHQSDTVLSTIADRMDRLQFIVHRLEENAARFSPPLPVNVVEKDVVPTQSNTVLDRLIFINDNLDRLASRLDDVANHLETF